MKLTEEQKAAVRYDKNLMLKACPGSGKTRVIVSKLSRSIDDVRGTPRAVACITYTNAGVHEVEARLRHHIQPGDEQHYDICTIHSFCLNYVFRPFCHRVTGYKKGFSVLTPESDDFEKHVRAIYDAYGRPEPTFRDLDDFTQLRIGADGKPVGYAIDRGSLTAEMAQEYWKRIRKAGLIDFANIIFYSYLLLKRCPEILRYVSAKFAWILVDEFQDTTDLQVEILSLIASGAKTRFFLVGDPYQSIFRFAGAQPDLADDFAKRISARTDMQLTGNFRSSEPIISHANALYPRVPAMKAVGRAKAYTEVPIREAGVTAFDVITDRFLPALEGLKIPLGDAAILAPTWFTLFPLGRRLREFGVSIVGPGARPYRRNRQFAPLAEQVCGFMMEPRPDAIGAIERTLFNTVLDATGRACFDIFSYRGRAVVFELVKAGRELNGATLGGIAWLEAAAEAFAAILINAEYLGPGERLLFTMSVEEMKVDMRNNKIDLGNLTIEDLGIYASPDAALKLSSLHNAKGREYEAVAMIDLHEGRIPHYSARGTIEIEEAKRLFYVGVTRAKRFLLYVTDNSARDGPTRFLRAGSGVGVL